MTRDRSPCTRFRKRNLLTKRQFLSPLKLARGHSLGSPHHSAPFRSCTVSHSVYANCCITQPCFCRFLSFFLPYKFSYVATKANQTVSDLSVSYLCLILCIYMHCVQLRTVYRLFCYVGTCWNEQGISREDEAMLQVRGQWLVSLQWIWLAEQ